MKRLPGTPIVRLMLFAIVAGAVVAAAALPFVGPAGLGAKAVADAFDSLPSELTTPQVPLTTNVRASDGSHLATFYEENRVDVALDAIPQVMRDAIVAAEDARFYEHNGVDPEGIARALVANLTAGGVEQGASTLTQQYVKQAQYYAATTQEQRDAVTADTVERKLQEMRYAVALEDRLSKDEILRRYLNIANFGNNSYGVAAASKAYFSKTPAQLTVAESALLAGIVQNPSLLDPVNGDKTEAKNRRDYVLQRMADLGSLTPEQASQAKAQPIALNPSSTPRNCENGNPNFGFFCGWFLDWWKANPEFGNTPGEREDNLYRGGYTITTSLDPKVQAEAQAAVDSQLSKDSPFATGIVVVEPGTGRVKAMAVNRDYGIIAPATTIPLLSGSDSSAGYQAGSTFKMFTMVAALQAGMPLSTEYYAPYQYHSQYQGGNGDCPDGSDDYCPKNASTGMTGDHDMWSAFGESVNTYFIQLEEAVGVKSAIEAAEKLGIEFRAESDKDQRAAAFSDDRAFGSFTLGVMQTTPLDVANAYATIAARGKHCEPLPLQAITDRNGQALPYADPTCSQVIPQEVADAAADAARCPVGDDAASSCSARNGVTASLVGQAIDRPVAGKTGTTDGNQAAWFAGFTPNLAAAAFVANPDDPSQEVPSGQIPIRVFIDTMSGALENVPVADFVPPTQQYIGEARNNDFPFRQDDRQRSRNR